MAWKGFRRAWRVNLGLATKTHPHPLTTSKWHSMAMTAAITKWLLVSATWDRWCRRAIRSSTVFTISPDGNASHVPCGQRLNNTVSKVSMMLGARHSGAQGCTSASLETTWRVSLDPGKIEICLPRT